MFIEQINLLKRKRMFPYETGLIDTIKAQIKRTSNQMKLCRFYLAHYINLKYIMMICLTENRLKIPLLLVYCFEYNIRPKMCKKWHFF